MNVRREGGIRTESSSAMSGRRSWSRELASTRSARPDLQFDRYLVTALSLMLAVLLVAGAGGYAGIHRHSSSTTTTAKLATLEQLNREVDPERIFTPAAIALAVIAVILVSIAARAASPRRCPIE
jgi:hypothetical protein